MWAEGATTCVCALPRSTAAAGPVSPRPRDARPTQLLGCRDSCIRSRGGGGSLGWGVRLCGSSHVSGFQRSPAAVALPLPPVRALVPVPCPPSPLPWPPHCPMPCAPYPVLPHPARPLQPPRFQALLSTLTHPEDRRCPPARLLPVGWPARPLLPQVLRPSLHLRASLGSGGPGPP